MLYSVNTVMWMATQWHENHGDGERNEWGKGVARVRGVSQRRGGWQVTRVRSTRETVSDLAMARGGKARLCRHNGPGVDNNDMSRAIVTAITG